MSEKPEDLDDLFDLGDPVPTSELVLDRDDFESDESMKKYFEEHPEAPRSAYDQYFATSESGEIAVRKSVSASIEYFIKTRTGDDNSGLPSNNVVQAVYVGTQYLYALQTRNAAGGADQFISRFKIAGVSKGSLLTHPDVMKLERCGHGQTLQWDGGSHFWVVVKATSVNPTYKAGDIDWGTQIGRISFQPGKIDYTKIPRISSINRANKSGASFGTLKRCEAALSSNRKYLLIWSQNTADNAQLAYYWLPDINSELDKLESRTPKYLSAGKSPILNRCKDSYAVNNFINNVPGKSTQGIEFADNFAVYVSSNINGPLVSKGSWKTTNFKKNPVQVNISGLASGTREGEGIQLKGDLVYVAVSVHTSSKQHAVVSIPKSAL